MSANFLRAPPARAIWRALRQAPRAARPCARPRPFAALAGLERAPTAAAGVAPGSAGPAVTDRPDRPSNDRPPCFGCGARVDAESGELSLQRPRLSYWDSVKQASLDYRAATLCARCAALRDARDPQRDPVASLPPIDPALFRDQVARIRHAPALVVLVTDSTDFEAGAIRSVRNLVGKNPILLAVTKCDLLPVPSNPRNRVNHHAALIRFFIQRLRARSINSIDVVLCSGLNKTGVDELYDLVDQHHQGRNVYFIGSVNAGKSTLVNAFIARALQEDHFFRSGAVPATRRRHRRLARQTPTTSALPGTTLLSIRIPCFKSHRHAVFDTPGLVPSRPNPWLGNLHLNPDFRSPIRPIYRDLPREDANYVVTCGNALVRIEIRASQGRHDLHNPERVPPSRLVWFSRLAEAQLVVAPESSGESAHGDYDEAGWVCAKELTPQLDHRKAYSADIVVWDVGWLAVCFPTPKNVRVLTPKVAAQVTARPCMFHPLFVGNLDCRQTALH